MNTETKQEENNNAPLTTGERLRQAREKKGLSQRTVAERLCLMLATVRDIEEDKLSPSLAPTFSRGYIRAYAKLLHISEDEVLPPLAETKTYIAKNRGNSPFIYTKKRRRWDSWLLFFTCLILFVVVSLSVMWWWQYRQVQQENLSQMAQHFVQNPVEGPSVASSKMSHEGAIQNESYLSSTAGESDIIPAKEEVNTTQNEVIPNTNSSNVPTINDGQIPANVESMVQPAVETVSLQGTEEQPADVQTNKVSQPAAVAQAELQLKFSADCWIEIYDSTGKVLASQLQYEGSTLNVQGVAPYRIKLGVPSAVQIYYKGEAVNLGEIAHSNRVVRLKIPLHNSE